MKKALINNELSITYPNAFDEMDLTELQLSFATTYKSMWGAHDKKHNVIISVIWKESGKFLQKLVTTKSLVQKYEKDMQKSLQKWGYVCDEFFQIEVAEQLAEGFRYSYQREETGVKEVGEAIVFRHGRCNYTLYYYTQARKAGANRAMYEDLLASLSFS